MFRGALAARCGELGNETLKLYERWRVFGAAAMGAVLGGLAVVSPAQAASVSTGYDINLFLTQGHPLADRMGTRWQPAVRPTADAVPPSAAEPEARPAAAATSAATSAARQTDRAKGGGWREATARASARGTPHKGIIAEISWGVLAHDHGPFTDTKEEGLNSHIEIRFASPDFLDIIGGPEPHIGANINTKGDTSQVFAGLSYEWRIWSGLFAGFSLGGAYHGGETDSHKADRKDLGCHFLFRESVTLGWEITENHKIAGIFDHISNAKLCDHNEGLENLGLRYSYRF